MGKYTFQLLFHTLTILIKYIKQWSELNDLRMSQGFTGTKILKPLWKLSMASPCLPPLEPKPTPDVHGYGCESLTTQEFDHHSSL